MWSFCQKTLQTFNRWLYIWDRYEGFEQTSDEEINRYKLRNEQEKREDLIAHTRKQEWKRKKIHVYFAN